MSKFTSKKVSLKRFLIRYFPPGVIIEYADADGQLCVQTIDLLDLSGSSDAEMVADTIIREISIISASKKPQLLRLVKKLVERQKEGNSISHYNFSNRFQPHTFPMSNCTLNKTGSEIVTVSHDRTVKIWNASDRIITGSFDGNAKIWDAETGTLYHTLSKHTAEIISLASSSRSTICATGGMDRMCVVWNYENGTAISTLKGHEDAVVSIDFHPSQSLIITGSFDNTAKIWDYHSGECLHTLSLHTKEISCVRFNFSGTVVATSSYDGNCILWDANNGTRLSTLRGCANGINYLTFDSSGTMLALACVDSSVKLFSTEGQFLSSFDNHADDVVMVSFNPQGTLLLSCSADSSCCLFDLRSIGTDQTKKDRCIQVLRDSDSSDSNIMNVKDNLTRATSAASQASVSRARAPVSLQSRPSPPMAPELKLIPVYVVPPTEKWEDIDFEDRHQPMMCTQFVNESYEYMKELEVRWRVTPGYMAHQSSIQLKDRAYCVDWLVNFHMKLSSIYKVPLQLDTLYLTINILDRFLSKYVAPRDQLNLIGVASFFIASKFEETYYPSIEHLIKSAPSPLRKPDILKMESTILDALQFKLGAPTPYQFLKRYAKVSHADQNIGMISRFLCEFSLGNYSLSTNYRPSMIAASAISHSLTIVGRAPWTATLQRYTGYTHADLINCMTEMQDAVRKAPILKTQAVYRKYAQPKYLKCAVTAAQGI
ncbi:putative Dynein assembly factor with WDR repeat domains 1 [Blattamonas nauphoetae]|uniref:Dynein assembly factor with WDR repeat domains 1 n=1 Tax=Blattamonas nauphoetae TaxID=2049346 RepID=A0ABQ9XIP6_9EUKA|nr:putative Dynein assembly factor with WDR repeat domains 1 [Blattamonas nauphoetae]